MRPTAALAASLALVALPALRPRPPGDADEPPREYTLHVDGVPHAIVPGRPLVLEGTYESPSVELAVGETRRFERAGIRFEYPAYFTWEADVEDADARTWAVAGNDFMVMVLDLRAEVTTEEFAASMAEQFEGIELELGDAVCELGGERHPVRRITAYFPAGVTLVADVLVLPAEDSTRVVVFQDSAVEAGRASDEATRTLALVGRTFAFD